MEKADNGESLLALSVDVNENEEASKTHASLSERSITGAPLPRLLNDGSSDQAYRAVVKSAELGKGYVYIASNGRNVNSEPSQLPTRAESNIVLDLAPECPRSPMDDSCVVISEPCEDGIINGFPESCVELAVGPGPGCGCSGGRTHRPREGKGMLPSARVSEPAQTRDCAGETGDSSEDQLDKGNLNSEPRPKSTALSPAPSCVGKRQPSCSLTVSPATDMKLLPNGDVDCGDVDDFQMHGCTDHCCSNQQKSSDRHEYQEELDALDKEAKVANGGLLIVNRSTCDVGGHACIHRREHHRSSPESCESSSRESCPVSGEASPDAGLSEAVSDSVEPDVSLSSLPEHIIDSTETESSETGLPVRPYSLRTNPNYVGSLSCDATPLSPDDDNYFGVDEGMDASVSSRNTFEVSRRQSAPDNLPDGLTVDPDASSEQRVTTKKHSIAEFLTRSLFSRKPIEPKPASPSQSVPGWKLFGKVPLRENPPKASRTIQQDRNPGNLSSVSSPDLTTGEFEAKAGPGSGPHPQPPPMRRKNLEFEPLSTTALILEDRPANLPAKPEEEAQRHRQEYDEMVAGAKRRELKEAQRKKRQMKERYRQEESIANAMVIWNTEVLPNWESMRNTRRVRDLWWQGLPPSVRGRVWSLAIGNELNITPELYEIFLSRAKEKWRSFSETGSESEVEDCGASQADRESSLDLIKLDISRTFPSLYIYQKGGPYHDLLHSVLGAYTCYRPDVGYVQGMSFIAAVLILNLEEADAFIAFANLLNKPCQMAFFRVDHDLMLKYFAAFEVFFEENLPRLFQHFQTNSLTPDLYLIDWIFTLYSKSLPLDVACRVWDVFCRDGEEVLFRTGLGILRLYQEVLLQMDFIHSAQFLSRLPDNTPAHTLFSCIANTQMVSSNRRWNQVFSALMKDGIREADRNSSPALRS